MAHFLKVRFSEVIETSLRDARVKTSRPIVEYVHFPKYDLYSPLECKRSAKVHKVQRSTIAYFYSTGTVGARHCCAIYIRLYDGHSGLEMPLLCHT